MKKLKKEINEHWREWYKYNKVKWNKKRRYKYFHANELKMKTRDYIRSLIDAEELKLMRDYKKFLTKKEQIIKKHWKFDSPYSRKGRTL